LGHHFRSFFLVADACSKLAEIADARARGGVDALAYSAAAAVAWPANSYRGDYARVERLFIRLAASTDKIKERIAEVLTGNNLPFAVLRQMPGVDQGAAKTLLERLANVR
jgi:hypothetical protein